MRSAFTLACLVSTICSLAARAQSPAQGLMGIISGGGGSVLLLMNNGVLEELKVTDDQKTRLRQKIPSLMLTYRNARMKAKDTDPQAVKNSKPMRDFIQLAFREISQVLTPEQVSRLKQIERQQSVGQTLMSDEEASKALQISEDQRDKFKEIVEDSTKETEQLYRQMNKDNAAEIQGKISSTARESNERCLNVLKDEQRAKWKELVGPAFEVKMSDFNLGMLSKKK